MPSSSSEKKKDKNDQDEKAARTRRLVEMRKFMRKTATATAFVHSDSWVLVEKGSFFGAFDWVPESLRIGPWSLAAKVYLVAIFVGVCGSGMYLIRQDEPLFPEFAAAVLERDQSGDTSSWAYFSSLEYPTVGSAPWWYNFLATGWMMFIMHLLVDGPLSLAAWGTYTVQSWTLLTLRHALCAAAPWSRTAQYVAELIRFPAACSATITFAVWNVVLMPFMYFALMKTPQAKQKFLDFSFSFRLVNIHVLNMLLVVLNCGPWGSPRRELGWLDCYLAVLSVTVYMVLYLGIYDRLGIHLYPIFSPRAGTAVVLLGWSLLFVVYLSTFFAWKSFLAQTT